MSRLGDAFKKGPLFMPYFPVGYPDIETSIAVLEALARNGADLIEVGLSFSDPLADGPVIQKATQRALAAGVTVKKAMMAVAELRRRKVTIPLVLMGYYNPILAYGLEQFVRDAAAADVDGFIIPDLPPEEAGEFEAALEAQARARATPLLPLIRMLTPVTPPGRVERLARSARGFIYLVSVTGVTGERGEVASGLAELVGRVRACTALPVCVGFGIATPEQAQRVGSLADGVIVGSACVRAVGESADPLQAAGSLARRFREALAGAG